MTDDRDNATAASWEQTAGEVRAAVNGHRVEPITLRS